MLGARRTDRIDVLVKDITAKGGAALGFQADVTKRSEVEALVQAAIHEHGRIDVIVNDAGIMPIAPMAALKVEEDRMIDVNIKRLLFGVAAVLQVMQKQKQGHIINMWRNTCYYDTNPLDPTGMFSQNALGRLTAVQYPPAIRSRRSSRCW
jgi:NADP-dependent 3-hydroxy acid dehydrogenase YdfG